MGYGEEHSWTQISGLWRLPYINDLLLQHNIDVMHIEKNWGEALFGTVMDIPDKTKIRNEDSETRETMEEDSGRFRPNEAPKKGSTRVDPKVTIPRWVCSESEEGS